MRLLCLLGIHSWTEWETYTKGKYKYVPDFSKMRRQCRRCGKYEYWDIARGDW